MTFDLRTLQLDIHTVAAGGGSRLFFNNGLFVVGPESAGAHPGPICYKKVERENSERERKKERERERKREEKEERIR